MSLQEVRQSNAETDGNRRMFQHQNICQYSTGGGTKKKTFSNLPVERYQHGEFDTGQSMQFNKDEASKESEKLKRNQKRKKPTMNRIEYKTSIIQERRDNLYARLIRKCAAIGDLFYSSRNIAAAQKEMCQFNESADVIALRNSYMINGLT